MREGPRPKKETLKSAVLAAGLLIGYEHGPSKAAEIPPEASWTQGSEELRRRALEEQIEFATTYIGFVDGSSGWLTPVSGDDRSVERNTESMIEDTLQLAKGKQIKNVCKSHTHPAKAFEKISGVTGASMPYMPPSRADVDLRIDLPTMRYAQAFADQGLTYQSVYNAVFEPHGVWYFREQTDDDLQQIDPQQYELVMKNRHLYEQISDFKQEISLWVKEIPSRDIAKELANIGLPDEGYKLNIETVAALLTLRTNETTPQFIAAVVPENRRARYKEIQESLGEWDRLSAMRAEQTDPKRLGTLLDTFRKNSLTTNFNFNAEYLKLQSDVYSHGWNAKVRFVPYEKLANEPPCAGPDYKPER
jgi:hypothetical protein